MVLLNLGYTEKTDLNISLICFFPGPRLRLQCFTLLPGAAQILEWGWWDRLGSADPRSRHKFRQKGSQEQIAVSEMLAMPCTQPPGCTRHASWIRPTWSKTEKHQGPASCLRHCFGRHCLENSSCGNWADGFWKFSKAGNFIGKGGCYQAMAVQLWPVAAPRVAPLAFLLTHLCQMACQLILIQHFVLARFRGGEEITPSGSDEKKDIEQNVTGILMAQ